MGFGFDAVMDCVELSVPRFVHAVRDAAVGVHSSATCSGSLIAHDRRRGTTLFDTLATYLRHGASKTETAKALHLQRQSLYQRLSRVFEVIGEPVPGSTEYGALLVAVELETARRFSRLSGRDLENRRRLLPSPQRCADLAGRAEQVVDRVPPSLPVQPLGGAAEGEHPESSSAGPRIPVAMPDRPSSSSSRQRAYRSSRRARAPRATPRRAVIVEG